MQSWTLTPSGQANGFVMKPLEFAPTRSIRVRWTLQELGVAFEAATINVRPCAPLRIKEAMAEVTR
jgi:hypothetical protein